MWDIIKNALSRFSSRNEDPKKPSKPLNLKNFVEYGGGIDNLKVKSKIKPKAKEGSYLENQQTPVSDTYYGNPRYDLLPQADRQGSALAGLFPKNGNPVLPLINFNLSSTKVKGLKERVAPRFQEQLKYMFDYIQSPKYRERLSKTYDKELEIRKQDPAYKDVSNRYLRNKDGSYVSSVGHIDDFRQGIFNQFTDNKALKKKQIDDVISRGIAELMGLTNKGIKFVDERIRTGDGGTAGAESFSGGTIFDTLYQKEKNRGSVANYVAGPNGPKDQYGQPLYQVDEDRGYTMPVHEFSHSSTTNDPFSYKFSQAYLQGDKGIMKGGNWMDNLHSTRSPTELKARIDVIRFLAKKNKIWDAGTTDITDEQLEKLMNHPNIRGNDAMGDVLRAIGKDKNQKKNFKWLLNNIAKNKSKKPSQPDQQDQGSLA
jgi:hypothetical protein